MKSKETDAIINMLAGVNEKFSENGQILEATNIQVAMAIWGVERQLSEIKTVLLKIGNVDNGNKIHT